MGETDTEPATEEPSPASPATTADIVAAWKARDRGAELKALAADPAAVAAMRRRLVSLGIQPAPNPFDGSQAIEAPAGPRKRKPSKRRRAFSFRKGSKS